MMDVDIERMVRKHHTDLYEGSGKDNPSITTRLSMQEECTDNMEKRQDKYDKKQEAQIWLLVTTLVAIIVELIHRW